MFSAPLSRFLALTLLVFASIFVAAKDNEPQWILVNSSHFSVLTDAGEKKGHDVIVRFEQMRGVFSELLSRSKVNMSEPIDIIALKSDKEYSLVAPIRQGQPIDAPGFFIGGDDRIFIVLNVFEENSWRAVAHQFAHYLLNYNYPPAPAWFDEGFAEYFSSMRLDAKQVQIGADPELNLAWKQDLIGNQLEARNLPKSLTDLLSGPVWLSMNDLFTMRHNISNYQEGSHNTLFYAQSWITMHFLINTNRLPETGMLLNLVLIQKMPVNDAIQKAYGMTPAQFDDAVKKYFKAQEPLFVALDKSKQQGTLDAGGETTEMRLAVTAEEVGTSRVDLSEPDGRSLVAEMALRLPEHRSQALQDLANILQQPKGDTAIGHRALGWAHLDKNDFDAANEELMKGSDLDRNDPWVRYYLALVKYRRARVTGQPTQGLANAMIDLRAVIDWDPTFAEAYGMLGVFRMEGGGVNSATESMRTAIQLSPRNEEYLLDMAHIYITGKKWDDATALLERLKGSSNAQVARVARKDLDDMPTLKKYGLLPQSEAPAGKSAAQPPSKLVSGDDSSDEAEEQPPTPPKPDTRPVKFLKAKLLSVDCSQQPAAIVTLAASARKTLRLRTDDFKSLALVGADQFSCAWKNREVSVNYKAGGKSDGDLVSLEVQ
jgi:tetratricopeptide (TPR) repeat protein